MGEIPMGQCSCNKKGLTGICVRSCFRCCPEPVIKVPSGVTYTLHQPKIFCSAWIDACQNASDEQREQAFLEESEGVTWLMSFYSERKTKQEKTAQISEIDMKTIFS